MKEIIKEKGIPFGHLIRSVADLFLGPFGGESKKLFFIFFSMLSLSEEMEMCYHINFCYHYENLYEFQVPSVVIIEFFL